MENILLTFFSVITIFMIMNSLLIKIKSHLWLARTLVGVVFITNIQSALAFYANPAGFAPFYELTGIPGQAAIRGFAILFLMWNVPYVVALINPSKYRISLYEAMVMQCIGLFGESLIIWTLPSEYTILRNSILRFIIFDGAGLIALIFAAWLSRTKAPADI